MHSQSDRFAFHFFALVILLLLTITLGACGASSPATPTLGIGSTMVSPVDDAVMVYVPEGDFLMGSDDESIESATQLCDDRLFVCEPEVFEDEQPMHEVYLDAFWIDQTEVTNEMFTRFVQETGYQTDAESYGKSYVNRGHAEGLLFEEMDGADWMHPQGPSSGIEGLDDHPVVHVSWNDANAYCDWAGRRLPTEAEWEKAARGTEGAIYPWGKQYPTGELLNFATINPGGEPEIFDDDSYEITAPAGTYPAGASPYNAMDMAGNVKEWVADFYASNYYESSPAANPEGPSSGIFRSLRGSSWYSIVKLHITYRGEDGELVSNDEIGFRCAFTPIAIAVADAPTSIPTSKLLPTATWAKPSPTVGPLVTPTPYATLSAERSVWVIASENGIYTVKPDGSGLTKVSDQVVYRTVMGPFFEGAPSGGYLAYTDWNTLTDEETLYLLSPSSGETKVITSISAAVGPIYQGDPFFEARQYLASEYGVAWSPDGRQLAFAGLIDGPTMDLYVYSVDDGSITRLTDGTTPTLRPIWSPDGKQIAHLGVPVLLTGGGPIVDSLWVARADGAKDRMFLDADDDEGFVGWIDNENLVVFSNDGMPHKLRTVHVESGSEEILWADYFNYADMNPETGTLLLGVRKAAAEKSPDIHQGLYLIQAGGVPGWRIIEDEPQQVFWSKEADLFFAKTEFGILAVSLTGDFIDLDVPTSTSRFPLVAPRTRELAWTGPELWVSTLTSGLDNPPRQIFPEPVYQAAWGPQGQHLLFISSGRLYVARSPEFSPVLVGEGLDADITAWTFGSALDLQVTQTPGQPAECPSPSGQTPEITSTGPGDTVVEIFEPQLLDYLKNVGSAAGLQAALSDLTMLDGAWKARPQVETVDVTGNTTPDVVVELTFYQGGQYFEGALFVFMCQDEQFVGKTIASFWGQVLPSGIPEGIRAIQDMNMDGVPEIVHSHISVAGTHAYFIRSFRIFEWDGQKFVDLIPKDEYGSYAQADTGDGVIRDADGDGTLELILSNGLGEAYPDLGPQRARNDIWAWDGYAFTLNRWEYTAPEFRIHAIWDGDDASVFGDYDKALAFYQQAIFDEELFGWSPGRLWPDEAYGGSPTPTPDLDERPRLNAYGRFRILLLHAVRGFQAEAQIVYDTLQEKFPEGFMGHQYAELATVFWDEYNESGDVGLACEIAADYAADHANQILTSLGRDYYGIGQREVDPEDICPFK